MFAYTQRIDWWQLFENKQLVDDWAANFSEIQMKRVIWTIFFSNKF